LRAHRATPDRGVTTRPSVTAILGAALVFFFAALGYSMWGGATGTVSSLSALGHSLVLSWTLIVAVLLAVFFVRESRATTGTHKLIELRKRSRGKWLLRGIMTSLLGSGVASLFAHLALARYATTLAGPSTQEEAEIIQPATFRRMTFCGEVRTRLASGAKLWICVDPTLRPAGSPVALCAKAGDRATVTVTRTPLGPVLRIAAVTPPRC
jgi:hypothetical protein